MLDSSWVWVDSGLSPPFAPPLVPVTPADAGVTSRALGRGGGGALPNTNKETNQNSGCGGWEEFWLSWAGEMGPVGGASGSGRPGALR